MCLRYEVEKAYIGAKWRYKTSNSSYTITTIYICIEIFDVSVLTYVSERVLMTPLVMTLSLLNAYSIFPYCLPSTTTSWRYYLN